MRDKSDKSDKSAAQATSVLGRNRCRIESADAKRLANFSGSPIAILPSPLYVVPWVLSCGAVDMDICKPHHHDWKHGSFPIGSSRCSDKVTGGALA